MNIVRYPIYFFKLTFFVGFDIKREVLRSKLRTEELKESSLSPSK